MNNTLLKKETNTTTDNVEKVDFYYFTDPACSHCWALDPVMNRVKHEWADHLRVVTVMGGMIENGMAYADRTSEEATEMASHWAEVGLYYNIPIDGSVWTENPISSTWPASIAYLAIHITQPEAADKFLRLVREAAFIERKNIALPEVLAPLLQSVGADAKAILAFVASTAGKDLLNENLRPMAELGVNGFPTVVIVNVAGEGIKVVGVRTPETYRKALLRVMKPDTILQSRHPDPLASMLDRIPTFFDYEAEKIYDVRQEDFVEYVTANLAPGSYEIGEKLGHRFVRKIS
ncbi:MAG: DsbA family protein [bacterium]